MRKRGLSDIVTGILLVFIILIALGIIWIFIKPLVESTSTVASAKDCILLETTPVKCIYSDARESESDPNENWFVTVRARRGADDAINVSEIKLVFYNNIYTPPTKTTSWNLQKAGQNLPNPYETTEAGFELGKFHPLTVSIAPFVNKDKRACNLSPELRCERYQYDGNGCMDIDENSFPNGDDYDRFALCYPSIVRGIECLGRSNPHLEQNASGQWNEVDYYDLPMRKVRFDITRDGTVNLDDYNAFLEAYRLGDMENCPA